MWENHRIRVYDLWKKRRTDKKGLYFSQNSCNDCEKLVVVEKKMPNYGGKLLVLVHIGVWILNLSYRYLKLYKGVIHTFSPVFSMKNGHLSLI